MKDSSTQCREEAPDGSPCENWVVENSPVHLCASHLRIAREFAHEVHELVSGTEDAKVHCTKCYSMRTYIYTMRPLENFCLRCGNRWTAESAKRSVGRRAPRPKKPSAPEASENVVYYIRHGGRIKIGTSNNFKRRLAVLPHDEVLALEPGSYDLEAKRHSQFHSSRIRRTEWFVTTEHLSEHIAHVRDSFPRFERIISAHNMDRAA